MLATVIRDVYREAEKRDVQVALDELCSPEDSWMWASAGIYCYWIPADRTILYVGLARDLWERFGHHNGLLPCPAGGCKREQIDEWFSSHDSIGLSIIVADLLLMRFGGVIYQFTPPSFLFGSTPLPFAVSGQYSTYRLFLVAAAIVIGLLLWLLLTRTKLGMIIRAGIDDRHMLSALGVDVPRVFLLVFALGAGLAGLAGVLGGSALSISPGEDARYLLSSLVVVILGGMGSLGGAAIGALIVGLAEQYGLFYWPYYAPLVTFGIMAAVLAVRPQGLRGRPA